MQILRRFILVISTPLFLVMCSVWMLAYVPSLIIYWIATGKDFAAGDFPSWCIDKTEWLRKIK